MIVHRRCVIIASSLFLPLMMGVNAFAENTGTKQTKSSPAKDQIQREVGMRIRLTINGKVAIATLDDTHTAKDFASLLPLHLKLEDYNATEKISDLPRRLSTTHAPAGHTPTLGDIAYYAPWGNLAIFYHGFRYSPGLIKLARIESGIDALQQDGSLDATIEEITPE